MAGGMKTILIGVILVVIALILAPLVIDQVKTVATRADIGDYPGAKAIVTLVPMMFLVGVLFLSGFLVFRGVKTGRNRGGP